MFQKSISLIYSMLLGSRFLRLTERGCLGHNSYVHHDSGLLLQNEVKEPNVWSFVDVVWVRHQLERGREAMMESRSKGHGYWSTSGLRGRFYISLQYGPLDRLTDLRYFPSNMWGSPKLLERSFTGWVTLRVSSLSWLPDKPLWLTDWISIWTDLGRLPDCCGEPLFRSLFHDRHSWVQLSWFIIFVTTVAILSTLKCSVWLTRTFILFFRASWTGASQFFLH